MAVKPNRQGKIPCFAAVPNARGHDAKKTREIPYGEYCKKDYSMVKSKTIGIAGGLRKPP